MSKEIDEKVVEMRFDNKQFEQNVSTTMSTLEKLKKSLQLKDSAKAFDDIDSAAKKVDFSGLGRAVEEVKVKFSALQVMAISALDHITRKAIDAGINLVKSLSVDQITAGWTKYTEKMTSVQAIMSATRTTWEKEAEAIGYTGEQMGFVDDQLRKLQWFTDETSYSYVDMVNNIGKFTSAGRGLQESVNAMEGISTWAANAGASVTEAGRAMYNLSQSMGMGHVQLMDWKSIENANMATIEFKQAAMEAGVAMGTLRKSADGVYTVIGKGTKVTAETFRETLNTNWFTSDVLINVLDQYGSFASKLHEFYETTGMETNEILENVNSYAEALADETSEGAKKAQEIVDDISSKTKVDAEEVKAALDELGSKEMELGRQSFAAAQETRTFADAINYAKDAVSSGWMQTFETIFGNYEDSKALWSELSDVLFELFVAGSEARNEMLKSWAELGGRTALIDSLRNGLSSIVDIVNTFKEAFRDFLPEDAEFRAKKLLNITEGLKSFSEKLRPTEETLDKLKRGFKGIFAIFDIFRQALSGVFKILSPVTNLFKSLGGGLLDAFAGLGDWLTGVDEFLKTNPTFKEAITQTSGIVKNAIQGLLQFLGKAKTAISNFGATAKNALSGFKTIASKAVEAVRPLFENIKSFFKEEGALNLSKVIKRLAQSFKIGVSGVAIFGIANKIKEAIGTIPKALDELKSKAKTFDDIKNALHNALESIPQYFEDMKKKIDPKDLKEIAIAIGILAGSLFVLSSIDPVSLGAALTAMAVSFGELIGAFKLITMISTTGFKSKRAVLTLLGLSAAIWILSRALKNIGSLNAEGALQGVLAIAAMAGILVGAVYLLSTIKVTSAGVILAVAFSMTLLAVSINMMVRAVKQLGSMDTEGLIKGIAAIGIIMLEMAAFAALTGGSTGVLAASVGMVVLAVAIKVLASALGDLSGLSWEGIGKGLVAIGGVLLIMTGILYLLSAIAPLAVIASVAVVIMSVAIKIIASAMEDLGSLSESQLAHLSKAIDMLGKLLKKMAWTIGLLGVLSPAASTGAIAMVIMTLALKKIISAMEQLSRLPSNLEAQIDSFGKILSKLSWTMLLLGTFSKKSIVGSVALILLGAGLKAISGGLTTILSALTSTILDLSALDAKQVSRTMRTIVVGIASLGIALKAFGGLSTKRTENLEIAARSIKMLAKPLETLSKSIEHKDLKQLFWDIAVGISRFGIAIKTFGILSKLGSNSLLTIANALIKLTPSIEAFNRMNPDEAFQSFDILAVGIAKFGMALKKYNFFSKYGADAIVKIANSIKEMAPALGELSDIKSAKLASVLDSLGKGFKDFGTAISNTPFWFPKTRASGITALIDSLDELKTGIEPFLSMPQGRLASSLTSISTSLEKVGSAIKEAPTMFSEDRANAIKIVASALSDLATGVTAFKDVDTTGLDTIGISIAALGGSLTSSPLVEADKRAEGIKTLVSSLKPMAESIKIVNGIEKDRIDEVITEFSGAIRTIGENLDFMNAWSVENKANAIRTVVGSMKSLFETIKAFIELDEADQGSDSKDDDISKITTIMTKISEGYKLLGEALASMKGWDYEKKANAIKSLTEGMSNLTEPLKELSDLDKTLTSTGSYGGIEIVLRKYEQFAASMASTLDDMVYWNYQSKADSIITLVDGLSSFSSGLQQMAELLTPTEEIPDPSEKLESIKNSYISFITDISSVLNDMKGWWGYDEKGNSIATVIGSLKDLASAINSLKSVNNIDTIATSIGSSIDTIKDAVKHFKIDDDARDSFSSISVSSKDLATAMKNIQGINAEAISSNLAAVSTALTSFSSSTSGIAESLVNFSTMGTTAATNFATGYSEAIANLASTFTTSGETAISSYNTGMSNKRTNATVTARSIASACVNAIRLWYVQFKNAGAYVVQGFVAGMSSQEALQSAYDAGYKLGEQADKGTKDATDENSPSKVFYQRGTYCVTGFVNSFYDGLASSELAGKDLAYSAIDGASFALKRASDILSSDLELQPTIRPVIDLSNVQNGVGILNGMLGARTMSVNTSTRMSKYAAATMTPTIDVTKRATEAGNGDIVSAINTLRSDVNALSSKIEGMQVTIDGKKTVGALTRKIDRSLGQAQVNRRKGV